MRMGRAFQLWNLTNNFEKKIKEEKDAHKYELIAVLKP